MWKKLKSHWRTIAPWAVAMVLFVALVTSISTTHRALRTNVVGTYGGNAPGTPSLTFDSSGHYALSQNGSTLSQGNYITEGRTITMDSDGHAYYALYMDDTIYLIRDGESPLPFLRTSRTAIYPHSP